MSSSSHPNIFRIYLDNFDQLRRVDKKTASLVEGKPTDEVVILREAYERVGLPRHPKKAVSQQVKAEVQGAWVEGGLGLDLLEHLRIAGHLSLYSLRRGGATWHFMTVRSMEATLIRGRFDVYPRRPKLGSNHTQGGENQSAS